MSRDADPSGMRRTQPSSAAAKSATVGGALPAEPGRVLGAGNAALCDGVAGVEVGPMRRNVEAAGFSGDQGVFVGLGGGQSA